MPKLTTSKCGICGQLLVRPVIGGSIGIVGEFPGEREMQTLEPFAGGTSRILERELRRAGADPDTLTYTTLWLHEQPDKEGLEGEYDWHFAQLLKTMKRLKVALICGSDVSEALLRRPLSEVCGIPSRSEYLPNTLLIPAPNPSMLFYGTLGEWRHALVQFRKAI